MHCRESDKENAGSYHDLMRARFGKWGGTAVAVAQVGGRASGWLRQLAGGGSRKLHAGKPPQLLSHASHHLRVANPHTPLFRS